MPIHNLQLTISDSHIRRWLRPALFGVLLLVFLITGFLISSRGLLDRWIGQSETTLQQSALSREPLNNSQGGLRAPNGAQDAARAAVVAVVNGQLITPNDLEQAIAVGRVFYRAIHGQPPGQIDEAGVVRQLVDDALVQQTAEAAGIIATEQEITNFIEQLKASQGIADQTLTAAMEAEGLTMDELRAEIRRVVINDKFVQQQVQAGVPADQAETTRANWLEQQRAQADIQMQQIAAAEPIASPGEPVVGALAPDFTLTDLAGNGITLSDLQGRAVLINFWATWCPPCQAEMPAIEATYQKFKDQGFQVLAVDVHEPPAPVQNFVQELRLTFPALLDEAGAVAKRYRVRGLPTSFFVNRRGAITAVQVGAMTPQAIEKFTTEAMASTQAPSQIARAGHDDEREVHWHARLRIIVNGREEQLFNLEQKQFIDIHHPNLTLGEALEEYQIDYAEDCIMDTCQEKERSGTLTVRINGQEMVDLAGYILQDGDEVVMELQ